MPIATTLERSCVKPEPVVRTQDARQRTHNEARTTIADKMSRSIDSSPAGGDAGRRIAVLASLDGSDDPDATLVQLYMCSRVNLYSDCAPRMLP